MGIEIIPAQVSRNTFRCLTALLCAVMLVPGESLAWVPWQQPQAPPAAAAPKIPNDQLDSLVAPIALYPDPLLAQVLAASTYPLEIIQLQQWLQKNQDLKGQGKGLDQLFGRCRDSEPEGMRMHPGREKSSLPYWSILASALDA